MHTPRTSYLTRLFRCLRLALHFMWMTIGTAILYPSADAKRRANYKRKWSQQILDILVIDLDTQPTDAPPGLSDCCQSHLLAGYFCHSCCTPGRIHCQGRDTPMAIFRLASRAKRHCLPAPRQSRARADRECRNRCPTQHRHGCRAFPGRHNH